jgi:hypothetical protein
MNTILVATDGSHMRRNRSAPKRPPCDGGGTVWGS